MLLHQENAPRQKSIAMMAKLHELLFEFLPYPPYSPDLTPSDFWLFADLKRMLHGKSFGSNEEVISETETDLETKDKSFNKKAIGLLEKHWNQCITLEGDCLWIKSNFAKVFFSYLRPGINRYIYIYIYSHPHTDPFRSIRTHQCG